MFIVGPSGCDGVFVHESELKSNVMLLGPLYDSHFNRSFTVFPFVGGNERKSNATMPKPGLSA